MGLRVARASVILILLVIASVLNGCNKIAAIHFASSSVSENQTATASDNVTSGTPGMPPQIGTEKK